MKFAWIFLIMFFIFIFPVTAQNNIYEFDENGDIILTSSIYKNNTPYDNATCNLTIYNPFPNENFINLSIYMDNKGAGIYSYNLTDQLKYNKEIYPLTLYCNDSSGVFWYDNRVGLKIGVSVYDYIIPGAILITIAFLFIFMSFKIDESLRELRLLFFYMGFVFILSSLFYGLSVSAQIPGDASFKLIFQVLISIFVLLIFLMIYLQYTDKLGDSVNRLLGTK